MDKDHSRNRSPHFLCASITASEDGSAVILNSAPSDTPIIQKKSHKVVDTEKRGNRRNLEDPVVDEVPLGKNFATVQLSPLLTLFIRFRSLRK